MTIREESIHLLTHCVLIRIEADYQLVSIVSLTILHDLNLNKVAEQLKVSNPLIKLI